MARATDPDAAALLARWSAWAFPGGEAAAREVTAVEWDEAGELRPTPRARFIPFTARQRCEAARTTFRWEAVLGTGALTRTTVSDACEDGRGGSVARVASLLPVARVTGPEMDRAQVMRWLASVTSCPPALLLHPGLRVSAAGTGRLRLAIDGGPAGAEVEVELDGDGAPLAVRGERPALEGRRFVLRPWQGRMGDPVAWEGLRIPTTLTALWTYPEGDRLVYRARATPVRAVRAGGAHGGSGPA